MEFISHFILYAHHRLARVLLCVIIVKGPRLREPLLSRMLLVTLEAGRKSGEF